MRNNNIRQKPGRRKKGEVPEPLSKKVYRSIHHIYIAEKSALSLINNLLYKKRPNTFVCKYRNKSLLIVLLLITWPVSNENNQRSIDIYFTGCQSTTPNIRNLNRVYFII